MVFWSASCGMLVPQLGTEPLSPAVELSLPMRGGAQRKQWRITVPGLFGELANEICFLLSFSTQQILTLTLGCE